MLADLIANLTLHIVYALGPIYPAPWFEAPSFCLKHGLRRQICFLGPFFSRSSPVLRNENTMRNGLTMDTSTSGQIMH